MSEKCQVDIENSQNQANTTLSETRQVIDELMADRPLDLMTDKEIKK